jgi:L-lactate dehydrogenase (cytochrome)
VFDFVDGGAGAEVTLRANEQAFSRLSFRPRPLVNVARREQAVSVLGRQITLPVMFAPVGRQRLVHPDGEVASARAAARIGTVFVLSMAASRSIEEVADAGRGGTLWFQAYFREPRTMVQSLVRRAADAGYHALCVTVDCPVEARKYRDLHNRYQAPYRIGFRNAWDSIRHPRWLRHHLMGPTVTLKNLEQEAHTGSVPSVQDPAATWEDLRWLRRIWSGPLVVKGILTREAARQAFDCGADGVVCSNHGGRVLDGLPASIDALSEVASEGLDRGKEVFLDSGIRRGEDVVKGLALGARACLIGRPYIFALAADGEKGLLRLFDSLRRDIDAVLGNLGRATVAELDASAVEWQKAEHPETRPQRSWLGAHASLGGS